MSKNKKSLALFEVISKSSARTTADLNVPGWMGAAKALAQPGDTAAEQSLSPSNAAVASPIAVPAATAPAMAQQPAQAPTQPAGKLRKKLFVGRSNGEMRFSTHGGRVRISLNYAASMVFALAVVVAMALMYHLGRLSGKGSSADSSSSGSSQQVQASVGAAATGDAETPVPARVKGKWYLVIQGVQGTSEEALDDAQKMAAYCTKNSEPANVVKYVDHRSQKQQYIVWSAKAFDSPSEKQALDYARQMEEMGKTYFTEFGKYKFAKPNASGHWWFVQKE